MFGCKLRLLKVIRAAERQPIVLEISSVPSRQILFCSATIFLTNHYIRSLFSVLLVTSIQPEISFGRINNF